MRWMFMVNSLWIVILMMAVLMIRLLINLKHYNWNKNWLSPCSLKMLDFQKVRITLYTMKIILTPQQKQQLEEKHDSTRDGRVRDRIKAVLLASEGWIRWWFLKLLVFTNRALLVISVIMFFLKKLNLRMVVAKAECLLGKECDLLSIATRR